MFNWSCSRVVRQSSAKASTPVRIRSGPLKKNYAIAKVNLLFMQWRFLFIKIMFVKYLHWFGIVACITLIISCFLPWVHFVDINQQFTGFYSYKNFYGKPGKFLVLLAAISLAFILLPKVWAKRTNLFLSALAVAYGIKSFVLFSSCYNNYCPQKLFGIYLMLACTVVMLISSVFPDLKLKRERK